MEGSKSNESKDEVNRRKKAIRIYHTFQKAIKHQTMNNNDEEKKAKQKKTKKQVMCVVLFIFVFCA